jgi:uncharacterized membrane protein YcaP (DUF421 family)
MIVFIYKTISIIIIGAICYSLLFGYQISESIDLFVVATFLYLGTDYIETCLKK